MVVRKGMLHLLLMLGKFLLILLVLGAAQAFWEGLTGKHRAAEQAVREEFRKAALEGRKPDLSKLPPEYRG